MNNTVKSIGEVAMTLKKKKTLLFLFAFVYLAVCALVFVYIAKPFISMMDEPGKFREWINSHGIFGPVIFFIMFVMQIFFAVIPGEPFEIAAGYTFGALGGTLLCIVAVLCGQIIIFRLVRRYGIRALEVFIPREKIESIKFTKNADFSLRLIFLLYLIPGIPKDIVAYGAGLSTVSLSSYILVSAVARLPSIVTSTVGGAAIESGNYLSAAIIFAVTAALSLVCFVIYLKKKKTQKSNSPEA